MKVVSTPATSEVESFLFRSLVSELSFTQLVQKISEFVENPIVIIDNAYYIIAYSDREKISDRIWMSNIERSFCDLQFIIEFNKLPAVVKGRKMPDAFVVVCPFSPYRKIVCPIELAHKRLGYAVLVACQNEVDDNVGSALKQIAQALALRWDQCVGLNDDPKQIKEKVMSDLLTGALKTEDATKDRLKLASITFPKSFYIASFQIEDVPVAEDGENRFSVFMSRSFNDNLFLSLDDHLVIFIPEESLESQINALELSLPKFHRKMGLSRRVTNIFRCAQAFEESKQALYLGSLATPRLSVYRYDHLNIFKLIDSMDPHEAMQEYNHPIVRKLKEYDEENNTELQDTLLYYLVFRNSLQLVAAKMYIHRNTVRLRLNKIEELFNIDLNDMQLCNQLIFSLAISKFLDNKLKYLEEIPDNKKGQCLPMIPFEA